MGKRKKKSQELHGVTETLSFIYDPEGVTSDEVVKIVDVMSFVMSEAVAMAVHSLTKRGIFDRVTVQTSDPINGVTIVESRYSQRCQ